MRIINTSVCAFQNKVLVIGFEGENERTQVRIDASEVFTEYPNATPSLTVKPNSGEAYPAPVNRDGTDVVWDITSSYLTERGECEIQLTFIKDSVVCKSYIGKALVLRSLTVEGEMPTPVESWVDAANAKLAEVDAQITELEGMVDTATDAATRAEQSESNATTAAANAATSAATASTKAAEAQASANTATAKAAEAASSATQAINSAASAADSERGAIAKAEEAAQSAQTATTKAGQATEAAQTATGKAGDASASARAAQESATDAASSATAASASETAAKASETAAGASATQAAQSVQDAGANAQTAILKAAEATQSATDAATFAGTATTKAGEAEASAQTAQEAKTAVEQTAEQLADSLEQIGQNTQDIAELDERKANIDGYYPDMTVGNAEQLNSSKFVENSEPYTLRTSGGTSDIGNREYVDAVVGGTLAWNQAVRDEASENSTDFADVVTVTDAVEDAAGVKVKIEPVQDLHGYSNPWPAGGGKNIAPYSIADSFVVGFVSQLWKNGYVANRATSTSTGFSFSRTNNNYGCGIVLGKLEEGQAYTIKATRSNLDWKCNIITFDADAVFSSETGVSRTIVQSNVIIENGYTFTAQGGNIKYALNFYSIEQDQLTLEVSNIQLEKGQTATEWTPYSNICPITGWDGVQVTRAGKNLFTTADWESSNEITKIDSNSMRIPQSAYQENYNQYVFGKARPKVFSCKVLTETLDGGAWFRFYLRDSTGSKIREQQVYLNSVGYEQTVTITIPDNAAGISIGGWAYAGRVLLSDMQMEFSETATDYEAYAGNTYDITLPTEAGTVYGGELTVNADGSGSLVVDRASVDMGELSWVFMNVNGTQRLCSVSLNPLPLTPKSDYYFPEIICSTYKVERVSQLPNEPYCVSMGFSGYGYGNRLIVNDEAITTVEQATEKLSGQTCVYKLLTPITYTLTAAEIRTLLGTNNVWADTGDLALTYTGTDEHLTLESGKKYLTCISGTDSMLLGSGQEITAAKGTDNVFDLTKMFGTAVADYVYGQGASFFRRWFGGSHYPYNAGELLSVEGLQSHDMTGFNQWDEEWELGTINSSNGQNVSATDRIRSKNYIPVLNSMEYYIHMPDSVFNRGQLYVALYDADKNYIRASLINAANGFNTRKMIPSFLGKAAYIRLWFGSGYGTTYKHDICINLAHNDSRNGEYEPYEKHSYPLDSTVILRGIPKVDANGVYWDGDRYLPDGTLERKRRQIVFDGSESWARSTQSNPNGTFFTLTSPVPFIAWGSGGRDSAISNMFEKASVIGNEGIENKNTFWWNNGRTGFRVVFGNPNAGTSVDEFKSYLQEHPLVIEGELAEPTTESAQPYHSTQWVSDWGTEEFVSTGIVPVGTETRYPANLRDKLQHLPDAASGNGSYLITQTDGQMVLTPFPAPPSTAGNYVLKATVVNGVATYTWEAAT